MIAVYKIIYLSPDTAPSVVAIRSAVVVGEIITRSVLTKRIAFIKSA